MSLSLPVIREYGVLSTSSLRLCWAAAVLALIVRPPLHRYTRAQWRAALVLGAGGAARAIVYALLSVGASLTLLNRTPQRARSLLEELGPLAPDGLRLEGGSLEASTLRRAAAGAEVIINATTLGMCPATDASPWPDDVHIPGDAFCYDVVYNPRNTRWLTQARAAGCDAADGLGMLVHQGAEALELWTGRVAPVEIMRAACEVALGGE